MARRGGTSHPQCVLGDSCAEVSLINLRHEYLDLVEDSTRRSNQTSDSEVTQETCEGEETDERSIGNNKEMSRKGTANNNQRK